jgi:uncharacterized repeat protein (TIGR03803 family)
MRTERRIVERHTLSHGSGARGTYRATRAVFAQIPALMGIWMIVCGGQAAELAVQRLATFSHSDDNTQPTSLIQGSDGCLYGTTSGDHTTNGTVFKLTAGGELTVLASFDSGATNVNGSVNGSVLMNSYSLLFCRFWYRSVFTLAICNRCAIQATVTNVSKTSQSNHKN